MCPLTQTLISPEGTCYLLLEQQNDVDEILDLLRDEAGLNMEASIILSRKAKNERLCIVKIRNKA